MFIAAGDVHVFVPEWKVRNGRPQICCNRYKARDTEGKESETKIRREVKDFKLINKQSQKFLHDRDSASCFGVKGRKLVQFTEK